MQVPVSVDDDPCRFLRGRHGPFGSEPANQRSLSNVAHTPRIKGRHGPFGAPRPCVSPSGYPQISHVHDRSPVIIPRDRFQEWLDPELSDRRDVQHLLDSLPEPTLVPRIVSPRVNSVRNNGPELIEPAE
ncbi:SOS response-associated peptidase family protein [Pseudarthrobacter defluvii]|uniref:SOS response-associated peptidase family protein n=1 Tax=Pseudarthrobacter defluvii TaxID=410837 RepID=UPI0027D84DF6|nr:SOS response-associated peptidase family protein [Pseudarthrobacter defluvii]